MKKFYIVLSQTGTMISKIISVFSKAPYNHASISLDEKLEVMFSFGRKSRYNVLNAGFVSENLNRDMFFYFRKGVCVILEVEVTDEEYLLLECKLREFINNAPRYRYNILGLFTMIFNIGFTRRDHYFCSQFVAELLCSANVWKNKPEKTQPFEFYGLNNTRVLYKGTIEHALKTYNPSTNCSL